MSHKILSEEQAAVRDRIFYESGAKGAAIGLGIGLVEGYETLGYALNKPHLRANLEKELKDICEGKKTPDQVLNNQICEYKKVFQDSARKKNELFSIVLQHGALRAGA